MPRPPNPEVRKNLLAAGLDLVHARGFAASGVKDITDAAGVPKGSFYAYFPSKEACVWPLLILTRAAVAGVEPRLMEVARALRLGLAARVFKIIVPAALPRIFVAFRLAAGIALIVAVTVEIAVNPLGLGEGIMTAGQA